MKKEKKELAVVVVGVIILLIVVAGNLKGKPGKKTGSGKKVSGAAQEITPSAVAPKPAQINEKDLQAQTERARAPWNRDPFVVELDRAASMSELKLQGISYGKDGAGFAFINNEIVKKGGKIGDYEVSEVLKDRVLVKKGSQSFYLTFMEE